jgi:hypothetical protein
MRSALLPDPWCFSCFDDIGGRIARVKDHIGEEPFGPECKTLCGRSVFPHGYPISDSDPTANYFCKICRGSAKKRGVSLDQARGQQ